MSHLILISLRILSIFSVASSLTVLASAPPIVNTKYGPVRGETFVLNTNKTLVRYLGIPFAHVTRFEAPVSPKPWKTTLNATSFGKSCPQNPNIVANSTKYMNEQCLTINVFVPQDKAKQNALLPVMVWIYGGGFSVGSSAYYNGAYLATEGGVMVVTFNYRVGALGFLSTGTKEMPGNYGLLDQVMALKWVQENIERFGGEPKNVTIFGQSAGGASVGLHMLSPLSYGLYHKVILQSGTAAATFAGTDNKTATELARALAAQVGCSMSQGLKACLQSKNVSEIIKAQENITSDATFLPVVDYNFLRDHPFNLLVNGKFNQSVPAMIGVTKNEGGFFVLHIEGISPGIPGIDKGINKTTFDSLIKRNRHWVYNQTQKVVDSVIFEYTDWTNATNPLVLRQKYMDVLTDALFKAPAVRSAKVFVKNNIESYFYCFDHLVSHMFPSWSGVVHGGDLVYVFGRPFLKYNKSASEADQDVEIKFSKQVISMWSNFAKNGKPTTDGNAPNWPAYTLKDEKYMSLSPSSSIQQNMLPGKMAFWNSLIPALTETQPTLVPLVTPTTKSTPITISPTGEKEAITDKKTENALIAVVVVLVVVVLVLVVVIWRVRRKLGNALSDPGPTTRLI